MTLRTHGLIVETDSSHCHTFTGQARSPSHRGVTWISRQTRTSNTHLLHMPLPSAPPWASATIHPYSSRFLIHLSLSCCTHHSIAILTYLHRSIRGKLKLTSYNKHKRGSNQKSLYNHSLGAKGGPQNIWHSSFLMALSTHIAQKSWFISYNINHSNIPNLCFYPDPSSSKRKDSNLQHSQKTCNYTDKGTKVGIY